VAWVSDESGWRPVTQAGFDQERFAICVWRSVRADGDTGTEKSRRTLELPGQGQAADALRGKRKRGWPRDRCGLRIAG
jgi:hypothetical protein